MSQIILDDDLRAKLNGLNTTVEVREPSGRVVGRFVPQQEFMRLLYDVAKNVYTDAEWEEALKQPGGDVLGDVLKRLGR